MGRKLMKTTRHKKLKAVDPFYSGDRKLFLDKRLVYANQKPFDNEEEEQKLSGKLREYMNLKEKLKQKHKEAIKKIDVNDNSKIKKKKIKNTLKNVYNMKPDDKGAEVPLRSVPELKKSVNESESAFMNRVDREVQMVLNRSKYETQFDCKLETQGDQVVVKKEKKMSEKKRRRLEKLKEKLKNKKESKRDEQEYRSKFKDEVKFGELAHQPPILSAVPRISKKYSKNTSSISKMNRKPGKRDLILKQTLSKNDQNSKTIKIDFSSNFNNNNKKTIQKPTNQITEEDRKAVIESYRQLKKTGKLK